MKLYAATSNSGKLAEFAASASGDGVEVLALPGLADLPEPVEDAATFMGNAELKAVAYSLAAPGLLVMADDSGLEVTGLGGEPGVRSARYAEDRGWSEGATKDERNNLCLIQLMEGHSARAARFVCALAVAREGKVVLRSEGHVAGELLRKPRGADGFGYDPLFLLPALGQTLAEVPREKKWELSHRGNAFRVLLARLKASKL